MKETERKKGKRKAALSALCFIAIGMACGFLIGKYVMSDWIGRGMSDKTNLVLNVVLALLELYAVLFLQIVLHEGGHLVGGLLTGYQFSSFRIGSMMWVRENGKFKIRKLSIAGTGGQCIMTPPDLKQGKLPVVLYNLGGSLMNLLTVLICGVLMCCLDGPFLLQIFFVMMVVVGLAYALLNGIPLNFGMMNNDGRNALELRKDPDALRAFWLQLKVVEQTAKGIRLKDMPEAWFTLPAPDQMNNSMIAAAAVFYENRLMDEHRFREAAELIDQWRKAETKIVGLHWNLLLCDRVFLALMGEKDRDLVETLWDKDLKNFMKQMKKFPSVIRTEYVYALLWERDKKKAQRSKESFERCAKTYPYAADLASEQELMWVADQVSDREM